MNKSRTTALFLAGCIQSTGSVALDLHGVYDIAKEHDPKVRQVREQLGSIRERKPQSEALFKPTVSASTNLEFLNQTVRSSQPNGSYSDRSHQYGLSLQATQPVYHRDYWIRLAQTDDFIVQGEAQLAAAEIDLMLRTATAYFNILAAADNLRTATAEKNANARQLEQAQQRFAVGLIAITDVHESQAAYDSSISSEIAAENSLSDAWETLREIIGEIRQPLAKLGDNLPLAPPQPNDIEEWSRTALRQNYTIISAQKTVDQAEKTMDIQHSGHYPTVDLVGAYSITDSNSTLTADRDSTTVNLQLSVPIYSGGAVNSRERQARYELQAAQESLDQQRRATDRQVRDAYRGVLSTISRVRALQSTVKSFQSALESTQAGLQVGTRTMVDVLSVTRSLYQAQRDYARARYDYIINGLLLHQAASTLTPELLNQANSWLIPNDTLPPPDHKSGK